MNPYFDLPANYDDRFIPQDSDPDEDVCYDCGDDLLTVKNVIHCHIVKRQGVEQYICPDCFESGE